MKNEKIFKIFVIILVISMLMTVLSSCDDRRINELEEAKYLLEVASEELQKISEDCKYAEEHGDFDSMQEELGITQIRCDELKDSIKNFLLFGPKKRR